MFNQVETLKAFLRDTCGQFHKTFWAQFTPLLEYPLNFDSGYAAMGVNYAEKGFIKLASGTYPIKHFFANWTILLMQTTLSQCCKLSSLQKVRVNLCQKCFISDS